MKIAITLLFSYYGKGALLANMLDLQIIHSTKGKKNLDDVMRYLYSEYYKDKQRGITNEELQATIEKVAGKKMDAFFNECVFGVKTIDYQRFF